MMSLGGALLRRSSRIGGLLRSATFSSTAPPSVLSTAECLERLQASHPSYDNGMHSMYSSVFGGITTDPAMMVVPLDDRMVHRGHAVFDTANIKDGKMYGLDMHISRLLASSEKACIDTSNWTRDELRHIILHTAAASGKRDDVFIRYWMSSGRGLFGIVPEKGRQSEFVALCHHYAPDKGKGLSEAVVSVPMKPPLLANIKSNNYLLNALTAMEAQEKGGTLGVQVSIHNLHFVRRRLAPCTVSGSPPDDRLLR